MSTNYHKDLHTLEADMITANANSPVDPKPFVLFKPDRMQIVESCIDFIETHRREIDRDAILRMANQLTDAEFSTVVLESALGVASAGNEDTKITSAVSEVLQ